MGFPKRCSAPPEKRCNLLPAGLAGALLAALVLLSSSRHLTAQTPVPSPTPVSGFTNIGITYYVDNDLGDDSFDCTAPIQASTIPPSSGVITGPCKTIQHAIDITRDRDLVVVTSQEPIQLSTAIRVPDLIGVVAAGFAPTICQNVVCSGRRFSLEHCQDIAGGSKVVLDSANGGPVIDVTAAGMPSLHALIAGFILGGTTSFDSPGAITLDHDAFTEVACNIIGQEDLPNVIGILTRGSEHAWIHDNTVHGSSQFPISVTLGPTPPVGGLGLVTDECLGGDTRTDQLDIESNLFAFNSNAGIWICSDGSGGHLMDGNNIRSNGRGVVLLSTADTTLRDNYIGDNYFDGVDILDGSQDNLLEGNEIESQEGTSSTGVLLQGSGVVFPLGNTLRGNAIRRNRVDVLIAGARGTQLTGNSITAIGDRTAVLLAIGNISGSGGPDFGQPTGTMLRSNKLYDDGVCTALQGCAIRLLPGVDVPIDAGSNDFGVDTPPEIQAVLWDQGQDAELGPVLLSAQSASAALGAGLGPVSSGRATRTRAAVTATPFPLVRATPRLTATPISGSLSSALLAPAPATPSAAIAGAAASLPATSTTPAAAPPAGSGPAPVAYVDPGNGNYYVELALCVMSASAQPVDGDAMTLSFFDGAGNSLGLTHVTASGAGCFSGDVGVRAPASGVQPATITIADASGANLSLAVTLGAPLIRTPSGPIQSQ